MFFNPSRLCFGVLLCCVLFGSEVCAQADDTPRVASMEPPSGAKDLDARNVTECFIKFNRPMQQGSQSVVGGGADFPKSLKVGWLDETTCILAFELEPDRTYRFSLNGGRFQGFKSAEGKPMDPVPVVFHTKASDEPADDAQKRRNAEALAALRDVVPNRYSHANLRGKVLEDGIKAAEEQLAAAPSDWSWARTVATLFSETGDLHLWVKHGDELVPSRSSRPGVDPLIRRGSPAMKLASPGAGVVRGVTKGGYGYLRLDSWSARLDMKVVFASLAELRETSGLVLDVRSNGGGDETLARQVAAWFVKGEPVYAAHEIAPDGWDQGETVRGERKIQGNQDAEKRFDKPTVVLMGPGCVSSTEAFLLMMAQADHVKLVGANSRGSSGNPKAHLLPNGVTVFVPSWRSMLPDGTALEGRGVSPDVVVGVKAQEFEDRDPILEAGLRILAEVSK